MGVWGGVAVALDEVDDAEDGVDGGVGDDAVAEVTPGAKAPSLQRRGGPSLKARVT